MGGHDESSDSDLDGDPPGNTPDDPPGDPPIGPERDAALDPAVAATTREELRTTFDYQVERLREIDAKAIEILKANLLLIGIVVTGGSIIVQTELDVAAFVNPFTIVGGLLLLASTGLAAVTYTASDLRGGLDVAAVDAVIAGEIDGWGDSDTALDTPPDPDAAFDTGPEFEERLLRSYAEWIDYNARVTAVNDLLATITVLLIFVAFVYVIAGVVVGAGGLATGESWLSFVGLTAAVAVFTWVAAHMDHLGAETTHPAATFDGIQISKGAGREEAWSSLRAMLGRRSPKERPGSDVDEPDRSERRGRQGGR